MKGEDGMMIKTIFFDLDGTLLPLDQDEFIRVYFYELGKFLDKKNYPKELIIKAVYLAIEAMFKNDGQITNEEVFAKVFTSITKLEYSLLENEFINFYETNFENVKITSEQSPYVKQIIQIVKEKGYKLILATNPLFPKIATYKRINWAGLSPLDFSYITTFENSRFSKPNINYYIELLQKHNLEAQNVLMIGNSVEEDMIVEKLGMDTFLLTECLINPTNKDITQYKSGNYLDLYEFIKKLPVVG